MSQLVNPYAVRDEFLSDPEGGMQIPAQALEVDPKFGSLRMYTPICRLPYLNFMKPKAIKSKRPNDRPGKEQYSATGLFNPNACGDMLTAIEMVAAHKFAPVVRVDPQTRERREYSVAELLSIPSEQGGLKNPLHNGYDNYVKNPEQFEEWQDLWFLNTYLGAYDNSGNPRAPIFLDENSQICDPTKFYQGCYGLMKVSFYSFDVESRGVGCAIEAVWFVRHGERMNFFNGGKQAVDGFAETGFVIPKASAAERRPSGQPTGQQSQAPRVHGFAAAPQRPAAQPAQRTAALQRVQQQQDPQYEETSWTEEGEAEANYETAQAPQEQMPTTPQYARQPAAVNQAPPRTAQGYIPPHGAPVYVPQRGPVRSPVQR
jgi:hypothetical protein